MYRGTWLLVGLPLLVAAFTVARPAALPASALPPTFDAAASLALADELTRIAPDRTPGGRGALEATRWVSGRLRAYGFQPKVETFSEDVPGRGATTLRNVVAVAPGRSPDVLVVLAHRDNAGDGPGANDNASGTAALIELARAYAPSLAGTDAVGAAVQPDHEIVFLSTDGGSAGALGAARFLAGRAYRDRIAAVLSLDAIAGRGAPRLVFAGDEARSPDATLVQTAFVRVLEQTGEQPARASALRQLLDLAFPFSLYEQAPFVASGVPAVTLTTGGDRPRSGASDTMQRLSPERLGELGRSAQALLTSLDESLELTPDTGPYVFFGARLVRGWAVQLVLAAALLPFLAAAVDLFARCRRRRIPLAPALRSYRSRLAFWLVVGALFVLLGWLGAWPDGAARPISPDSPVARNWPVLALAAVAIPAALAWLVVRERLLPRRAVAPEEELAGYTAVLLVLGVLGLVVVAVNAFALLFLLPAAHAWLWLPQVRERRAAVRLAVLAAGFAGPLLLVGSFAVRLDLGLDAPWYLAALAAVGYVSVPMVLALLVWLAAAAQVTALAAGRYAPYPGAAERGPRGPVRELVRRSVLAAQRRRDVDQETAAEG
jgi:hypothetical protein